VYDVDGMTETPRALKHAFGDTPRLVAHAINAHSAGTLVRAFAAEGGDVDAVSGAEAELALACGVPANRIVMSDVAKTDAEIAFAQSSRIRAIQAESAEEPAESRPARKLRATGPTSLFASTPASPASRSSRTPNIRPVMPRQARQQ